MPEPDEFLDKFGQILESPMMHIGAKAHKIVDMLDDLFARSWIYSRHLALIVECFAKYGYVKQTKYFGTYRVDLVIALFARVVDLHNFEFVVSICCTVHASIVNVNCSWMLCRPMKWRV